MRINSLLPLLLVTVLFATPSFAQPAIEMFCTSKQDYIAEAKKRQWIVELLQEDPLILKQLKKQDKELQAYKKSIETNNALLQKVIAENWSITEAKPEFKSKTEVDELVKKNQADGLAILNISRYQVVAPAPVNTRPTAKKSGPAPFKEEANLSMRLGGNTYRHIGAVNLPSVNPTEGQMMVALQLLQNHFIIREHSASHTAFEDNMKQNGARLKTKTLLVPKNELKKGITEEELKTVYPYAVKIADKAEIEQAILSKSKEYCYVQTLPVFGGTKATATMQLVVDAEDGKLLARSMPPAVIKGAVRNEIKKDNFKDYLELLNN